MTGRDDNPPPPEGNPSPGGSVPPEGSSFSGGSVPPEGKSAAPEGRPAAREPGLPNADPGLPEGNLAGVVSPAPGGTSTTGPEPIRDPRPAAAAPVVTFGSDRSQCDLYIERKTVSSRHAEITLGSDGALLMTDLGSTNGTWVRGRRLAPDVPVAVRLGDVVSLGRKTRFELRDWHVEPLYDPSDRRPASPLPVDDSLAAAVARVTEDVSKTLHQATAVRAAAALRSGPTLQTLKPDELGPVAASGPNTIALPSVPPAGEVSGTHGDAPGRVMTSVREAPPPDPSAPSISLGYAESNDIIIPNPVVSGRHARIYLQNDGFIVEDQTSTNGTWIHGRRVERAWIESGTAIALGSHRLVFDDGMVQMLRDRAAEAPDARASVPFAPGRELTIGRRVQCDVVLEAPMVSGHHATLTVLPAADGYVLEDAGSTNGTFLNSRGNRVTGKVTVFVEDVVFLGSYRLPVARLPALVDSADSGSGDDRRVFVVGRVGGDVDIGLDSPIVSARHAEIEVLGDDRFRIRDLGSANGTFVNGVAVRGSTVASSDDRLSLGSYEVRLDASRGVVRREYHGDIMLQADRVTVEVPDHDGGRRRILDDVSFTVFPTEFVGLMGPSGAGKTTLMMALGGIMPPARGRSLVNGQDLYESYNAFRGNIGYVPQDDIVYPQLTVYESLYYTARLRLPADTTRAEIDAKISSILEKLEISHTSDTLVGDALEKGISGGERKRVNLAQELITEPALLFLDEPTSGLASEDTINVMRLLRDLADSGKTILLTIHQPSLEAYRLMDTVIYLFRGNLVYYGPAYPDSILHFNQGAADGPERERLLADPGNAMKPLAQEQRDALTEADPESAVRSLVARHRADYARSRYHREYVHDRASETDDVEVPLAGVQKTWRRGMMRQWGVLSSRAARIKWKDRMNTAILLVQAPIIALILSLVFASDSNGYFSSVERGPAALFLLVASAVWFGCANSAREIVSEQAIYRRERMVNLMIPSYVLSKVTVLGVVCAVQCLLLLGIVWSPLNLEGSFAIMYAILLLTSLVGLGMGLMLSALVRSEQAAMALVPLILIPQIILGGVIMPVHDMGSVTRFLAGLTATRWGYEAMLHAEFGDDDLRRVADECGIPECVWSTGATGFSFAYYSGDPDDVTETEETGGVAGLRGGQVPFVLPSDTPLCQAFCASVKEADPITPLDRSFGPDARDPLRVKAVRDIAVDGYAPDLVHAPERSDRTTLVFAAGVLAAFALFFGFLVAGLLRYRDVEVG